MKSKFLIIVTVFVVFVFSANWVYGNLASKKMDKQLQLRIHNSQLPLKIQYANIKVNPLFSKVTFYDLKWFSLDGKFAVNSEKVIVNIPYADAMELSQTNSLEEIKSFAIKLYHSTIMADNKEVFVENLLVDFEGLFTRAELENIENEFPSEKQHLFCQVKNIKRIDQDVLSHVDFLFSEDGTILNEAKFDLMFNPKKRSVSLSDLVVKNKLMKSEMEIEMDYVGAGINDVSIVKVDFDYKSSSESGHMMWGDPETTGRFSVKNIEHNYNGVLKRNSSDLLSIRNIEKAQMNFLIEGLKIEYKGKAKQNIENQLSMLGIQVDDVEIENFHFNSDLNKGMLTVKNTRLVSSLVMLNLNAFIQLDELNLQQSNINKFRLEIGGLSSELNQKIEQLATAFNIKIPRENNDIVLDVSGTFEKPHLKGIN